MIKDTERLKQIINTHLRPHEVALLNHIKEIFPCVKDKKENVSLSYRKRLTNT